MNTNFLNSLTNFLKKRTFEFLGLVLILAGLALAISFATYAPEDPSFIYGESNVEIKNFFGIYGSSIADFLLQSFGLASFLLLANFIFWGISLLIKKEIKRINNDMKFNRLILKEVIIPRIKIVKIILFLKSVVDDESLISINYFLS